MPAPIDANIEDIKNALNKTSSELEVLVNGQSSSNILKQTEEVQFPVVIVCVCLNVLCFYFN